MVEVFKTNVIENCHAKMIIEQIHQCFIGYRANFDLEDCDKILRVKSLTGTVQASLIIHLLQQHEFNAEVLPDELPVLL
ncbi:MAG: hypothetical protein JWQ09_5491 [Segetibacter sp.]|nr:hypothetical protein [Segetibacter sp.]